MHISGFTGISLIDYPDKICSIIFTSPCNFKCPFCHNVDLIEKNENIIEDFFILDEINKRKDFIDAVVITGGEPTLQDDIENFLLKIKETGLSIKLDTNGYLPEVIERLLKADLIDYISMDIKTSTDKYAFACGVNIDINRIIRSIDIIKNSGINYNFRTTCVPDIVNEADIEKIAHLIKDANLYILQQFSNEKTFDTNYQEILPYEESVLEKFAQIAGKYVKKVKINNILRLSENIKISP